MTVTASDVITNVLGQLKSLNQRVNELEAREESNLQQGATYTDEEIRAAFLAPKPKLECEYAEKESQGQLTRLIRDFRDDDNHYYLQRYIESPQFKGDRALVQQALASKEHVREFIYSQLMSTINVLSVSTTDVFDLREFFNDLQPNKQALLLDVVLICAGEKAEVNNYLVSNPSHLYTDNQVADLLGVLNEFLHEYSRGKLQLDIKGIEKLCADTADKLMAVRDLDLRVS